MSSINCFSEITAPAVVQYYCRKVPLSCVNCLLLLWWRRKVWRGCLTGWWHQLSDFVSLIYVLRALIGCGVGLCFFASSFIAYIYKYIHRNYKRYLPTFLPACAGQSGEIKLKSVGTCLATDFTIFYWRNSPWCDMAVCCFFHFCSSYLELECCGAFWVFLTLNGPLDISMIHYVVK